MLQFMKLCLFSTRLVIISLCQTKPSCVNVYLRRKTQNKLNSMSTYSLVNTITSMCSQIVVVCQAKLRLINIFIQLLPQSDCQQALTFTIRYRQSIFQWSEGDFHWVFSNGLKLAFTGIRTIRTLYQSNLNLVRMSRNR